MRGTHKNTGYNQVDTDTKRQDINQHYKGNIMNMVTCYLTLRVNGIHDY